MRLVPLSLRNRLVLVSVAVGLAFALLFAAGATWSIGNAENQAIDAALKGRLESARAEVTSHGDLRAGAGSPRADLVQVLGQDGRVRSSSPSLEGLAPLIDGSIVPAKGEVRANVALQAPDIDLALVGVPVRLLSGAAEAPGMGVLIVAVDTEGFNTATSNLQRLLLVGLPCVVVAIAMLSWVLTGLALRSVTRVTESAEALGPDDLARGLGVPRRDAEMARLVGALNRMLARLHESHSTELAFAADAGHRLRTPLATLRAEAELAVHEDGPGAKEAALERIIADTDQLTLIVDRMLARSRARSHSPQLVVAALQSAASRWQRRAELGHIDLEVNVGTDISPEARCAELVEILEPVVDNAVRHTPTRGRMSINVSRQERAPGVADEVVIDVTNTGDGVAAELAPHLFDAWVSSRDASIAGGLGLWLARETAHDVGGEVTLGDGSPDATTFRIVLPLVV